MMMMKRMMMMMKRTMKKTATVKFINPINPSFIHSTNHLLCTSTIAVTEEDDDQRSQP